MTHAFFKALLFLCAGSVMHAMHNETDFRKMGGLKEPLKKTYMRFLVGGLAISGIIPFAGFFSKDAILLGAFASHHYVIYAIGLVTAVLTAYYTFRVIFRVFFVAPADTHAVEHAHESPSVMLRPLTVLMILSIIGGLIGTPWYPAFDHFLEPVFGESHHEISHSLEYTLMGVALLIALIGIGVAALFHYKKPQIAERLVAENGLVKGIHRILYNKWYVDEIYNALFVRPIYWFSDRILFRIIDVNIIDGIVNDVAAFLRGTGRVFRSLQTGDARTYAVAILIGTLALIAYFVWMVR
jgi:NADH-quinone oxidoreductase subunit L